MGSNARTARIAGLLYLVVVLTGILSLAYVPSKLMVPGDTAATVANILANEQLFRVGIAAGLVCYTAFLLLPLVLYRLLAPAGRNAAAAMVALAVASVPISLLNVRCRMDLLSLLHRSEHGFSPEQLQVQARMLLDSYSNGILTVELFWGLWLLPLGYLVVKSGAIPRILGVFLMLGCAGYMIEVFGSLLIPGFDDMAFAAYVTKPAAIGEIGTCLWLLIMGARPIESESSTG
ncbi:MAG: DUF4386 domain-containing protein [Pseudomonadota bacterium]